MFHALFWICDTDENDFLCLLLSILNIAISLLKNTNTKFVIFSTYIL